MYAIIQTGGNVEYNENGLVVKTGCDRCAILKNGFEADKLIMNFNSLLKDGKFAFDTTKEPSHILFFIGINYGDLKCFASGDNECLVEDAHRFSLSQQTVNDLFNTAIGEMNTLADAIAGG